MALKDGYRVRQLTTAVGDGVSIPLIAAEPGFQNFSSICTPGGTDTFLYSLEDCNGTAWEYGIGLINVVGQLVRYEIIRSTNSNAPIVLSTPAANKAHEVTNGPIPGRATGDVDYAGSMLSKPLLKNYTEVIATPAIGTPTAGALVLDLSAGNVFAVDHTANITGITITNVPTSGSTSFTLQLKQGAGGSTAVAAVFPTSIKWIGGTAPTLVTTANKKNIFTFVTFDAGATWSGTYCGASD